MRGIDQTSARWERKNGAPSFNKGFCAGVVRLLVALVVASGTLRAKAETCTTQSQMQPADRDALAGAARALAGKLQAADMGNLQAQTVAELAKSFGNLQTAALELASHLKGDGLLLDQVYLLDASGLTAGAEAQFFCTLNRTQAEVNFSIAGLTPGVYGFAVVNAVGSSPWRVSMLLRRDGGQWLLAGFFPGATQAVGHDGVWYWREARRLVGLKQSWNAWLYYNEAQTLMRPAAFVQSTHLERLADEQKAAAPPALSAGINAGTPLVVKGPDNQEYRFTGLSVEALSGRAKAEVLAHVEEGAASDPVALRTQADGAAQALVSAYPELKGAFDGVLVAQDAEGRNSLVTEHAMSGLH